MICPPCRQAGDINAEAVTHSSLTLVELMMTEATRRHWLCESPVSCPCHHVTGRSVVPKDSEVPK